MSVLVPETLAVGGLVIVGAQPVAAAVTLVMDKCGKMRAARDARLAQWRAPDPPGAVAVAAPGSPPASDALPPPAPSLEPPPAAVSRAAAPGVPASPERVTAVLEIRREHPDWTWDQIARATGETRDGARGLHRRWSERAAANGSA